MIKITDKAATEIKRLRAADPAGPESKLRVRVIGGGCSGMSYKLEFEKESPAADKQFEQSGVQIVVDSKSYLFLQGIELDFTDGLNGTGFVFNNPNAKRTCGCGTSFSV